MGACSNAPMCAINDYYYEDLTPETLDGLVSSLAAGEKPEPGSAIGRRNSAPEGEAVTLTDPALYDGSRARPIKLPGVVPA